MKLLVGLGNPGTKHHLNRHNIGFLFADFFVHKYQQQFQEKRELSGELALFSFRDEKVVVLKPHTYMNRSGESVRKVMQFYKIAIEDVIVMHDELDIEAGVFRVKKGGGHGGHNGLRSIHPLGADYVRLRLGIGRPINARMDVAAHVLGNFSEAEQADWERLAPNVIEAIEMCMDGETAKAMNLFNRKEQK